MRRFVVLGSLSALALAGCGLEELFANQLHDDYPRPASAVSGAATWSGAEKAKFAAVDGDLNPIAPFLTSYDATTSTYQMNLPSSKYTWVIAQGRSGNMLLSNIVPVLGQETVLTGVDLNARSTTETLIVAARLGADGLKFKQLTPSVYLGTRAAIQAGMDVPGPTQDLLHMVERIMAKFDKDLTGGDPAFFNIPVYDKDYKVKTSAIMPGYLARHPVDYAGSGLEVDSLKFDAQVAQAAKISPSPAGCPDPTRVRLIFSVDFNSGTLDGNCSNLDRFKWAKDAPGKSMFFVGFIHVDSEVQDPAINSILGASTPNTIKMYDDGTNGDEKAGDNIWTVAFDVPRNPNKVLRVGYKYTWGTQGAQWSGSEEWPGNSRLLEVIDDNGDSIVWRRDVFGDEATNKDKSNLYSGPGGNGVVTFTTDQHGCGTPESHENKYDNSAAAHDHNQCKCLPVPTPKAIGPINRACTGP